MITAAIAKLHLSNKTAAAAEVLIDFPKNAYPYADTFIHASHWIDDIKEEGRHEYDSWHYISWYASGDVQCPPDKKPNDQNILWALQKQAKILYGKNSSVFKKAFALRVLLHLMGDLHQPLHAATRCSNTNPGGDDGGNRFRLGHPDYSNLHMFWDSLGGQFKELDDLCPFQQHRTCVSNKVPSNSHVTKRLPLKLKITNLTRSSEWSDFSFVVCLRFFLVINRSIGRIW